MTDAHEPSSHTQGPEDQILSEQEMLRKYMAGEISVDQMEKFMIEEGFLPPPISEEVMAEYDRLMHEGKYLTAASLIVIACWDQNVGKEENTSSPSEMGDGWIEGEYNSDDPLYEPHDTYKDDFKWGKFTTPPEIPNIRMVGLGVRIFEPVIMLQAEEIAIGDGSRIDSFVKLQGGKGLTIGKDVHIASFCTVNAGGGEVELHDGCGLSNGVVVCGGMPDLRYEIVSAADIRAQPHKILKKTVIGRGAVVFANATILPGVSIGSYSVVGAGAVVTEDIPPYEVWMGNPARFQRSRLPGENLFLKGEKI